MNSQGERKKEIIREKKCSRREGPPTVSLSHPPPPLRRDVQAGRFPSSRVELIPKGSGFVTVKAEKRGLREEVGGPFLFFFLFFPSPVLFLILFIFYFWFGREVGSQLVFFFVGRGAVTRDRFRSNEGRM
ncbi:hypothetical protein IE53DRAFT_287349 [Violaceomyces palustris]|uniref:Uncharacterized protein n=1 Tax=Violaceomyces palustris TaxID=1673888 RepID=A0ACD0NM47_9BASI|nr:hypothetical protein IE53DRAFT_287349 [Violaceomyces palustris]